MSELPKGWISAKFSELNQFSSSTIEPTKSSCETFELYSVPAFPMRSPELALGSDIGSTKQTVAENDVLVCKINPRINRVWTVLKCSSYRKIASSEWIGFRSVALHSQYAQFYFQSPKFRDLLCADVTGVGGSLTRAQPKRVATFDVPVAPLPEQKRIAEKLDATLARVDACRERLARVAPILKRFRQSVLAAATSGQLTEDWREAQGHRRAGKNDQVLHSNIHAGQVNEISPNSTAPSNTRLSSLLHLVAEIPQDWKRVTLEDIIVDLRYGTSKKCEYLEKGKIVLRIPNMGDKWKLDLTDLKYAEFTCTEVKKLELSKGDLLLIRSNGSVDLVGKTCLVTDQEEGFIFAGYLMRMRANREAAMPEYVCISMSGPESRAVIELTSKSTSGVNNINSDEVKRLPINLPPLDEQTEIVRRVETLFAFADRLEARLASATAAAERLTPSLLAKAFRGELVPQDPNDEPASELLKRLAASRESAGKAPKAKRGHKPAAA